MEKLILAKSDYLVLLTQLMFFSCDDSTLGHVHLTVTWRHKNILPAVCATLTVAFMPQAISALCNRM